MLAVVALALLARPAPLTDAPRTRPPAVDAPAGGAPGPAAEEARWFAPGALWAVDGDTVELPDGRRLRLDGLDTPEHGRPGAERATRRARGLLAARAWRLEPPDPPRDVYGRLLGHLRDAAGRDLGDALLAAGEAWIYRGADPARLALQAAAVQQRRGVHAGLDAVPGPFLVTATSFHLPDCGLVRGRGRDLPWAASAAALLKAGQAPCRRCLRWPPRRAQVHWVTLGRSPGPEKRRASRP